MAARGRYENEVFGVTPKTAGRSRALPCDRCPHAISFWNSGLITESSHIDPEESARFGHGLEPQQRIAVTESASV